jgi:hypothetical protein
MSTLEVTGRVRSRFIHVATLLSMLDPVRGEASIHSVDEDPTTTELTREQFLKRKFLDSFALICAVRKGGDSVSAACIEEGGSCRVDKRTSQENNCVFVLRRSQVGICSEIQPWTSLL